MIGLRGIEMVGAGAKRRRGWMLSLAAVATLGAAAPAQAAIGGFNAADGTETGGNCTTVVDWSCLTGTQVLTSIDGTGNTDNVFVGGGKEDSPDGWKIAAGTVGTAKADIRADFNHSFTDPSFQHNYVALGFNRTSGSGDSYFAFELNQSNHRYVNSAGSSIVCRTNGDVIVAFDIHSSLSSLSASIYKWTWNTGAGAAAPCTAGATGTFSAPVTLSAAQAELAVNTAAIANHLSTGALGTSFATGTFGETAIDLGALATAVNPGAGCEFFNHLQMTSRSSSSINASLEDYVDNGHFVARACSPASGSGGSGGTGSGGSGSGSGGSGTGSGGSGSGSGSCTAPVGAPTVSITSPADNATVTNGTVVISGTSNQCAVEIVDGTDVVGEAIVGADGVWTITLTGVSAGDHTYTAVVTDAGGNTATATVHVTVTAGSSSGSSSRGSSSGSGSGTSTSGSGAGTGAGGSVLTADGSVVAEGVCGRGLALADIFMLHGKGRLIGVAPVGSIGKRVLIISAWNHRVVARVHVARDLTFSAAFRLPSRALRTSGRARYYAVIGTRRSASLRLARRLYNTSMRWRGRKVTLTGLVVGPYARPARMVAIRTVSACGGTGAGKVLARVRIGRGGTFRVTFTIPRSIPARQLVAFRTQVVVQGRGRRTVTEYGLPRVIRAS